MSLLLFFIILLSMHRLHLIKTSDGTIIAYSRCPRRSGSILLLLAILLHLVRHISVRRVAMSTSRGTPCSTSSLSYISMLMVASCTAILKILWWGGCSRHMLVGPSPTSFNWHFRVSWSGSRHSHSNIVIIYVTMGILRVLGVILNRILRVVWIPWVMRLVVHLIEFVWEVFIFRIIWMGDIVIFAPTFSVKVGWVPYGILFVFYLSALCG